MGTARQDRTGRQRVRTRSAELVALLAVAAAVLLFRYQVNSAWLVLAGGVIGLALSFVG